MKRAVAMLLLLAAGGAMASDVGRVVSSRQLKDVRAWSRVTEVVVRYQDGRLSSLRIPGFVVIAEGQCVRTDEAGQDIAPSFDCGD